MAIRPVVLIFQEIATPSFAPATPDLNCLVVGPAYFIMDYFTPGTTTYADKSDIRTTADYGLFEAVPGTVTPTGTGVISLADAPNNAIGALVDDTSLAVYFDAARVQITNGTAGSTDYSTPTKFDVTDSVDFTGVLYSGIHKVLPGDRIMIKDPSTSAYIARTVLVVDSATELHFTQEIPAAGLVTQITVPGATFVTDGVLPGDVLTIAGDTGATNVNGSYIIDSISSETVLLIRGMFPIAHSLNLVATIGVTGFGGSPVRRTPSTSPTASVTAAITLFTPSGTGVYSHTWRIERQLNDQVVPLLHGTTPTNFYSSNGNLISINGSITLNVPTQGYKTVTYAKVYIAYRSLRQDLRQIDIVTSLADITAKIGRVDARNPLAVGAFVALQNTTTQVQFYGVKSDDLLGHTDCRDKVAPDPDVYAVVPLTTDISTIAMWNADCLGLADVSISEMNGRPQRFRVVIGSGTLPTVATLINLQSTGKTAVLTGSAPATVTKLTAPAFTFVTKGVQPGNHLVISQDSATPVRHGTYIIAQVVSETVVELDPSTPITAATANASIACADCTTPFTATAITAMVTAATDDLYLLLQDPNGTFISSGLMPTDIIEMPADPTLNVWTGTVSQFIIAAVLSENKLQLVNLGQNTATVQNELPHGNNWATPKTVPATNTLYYRIVRNLTKTQQVTNLIAVAQSFRSRRTVLVWPNLVDVAGIAGPTTGLSLPGYYLSCAVGGMTAGLPPHQGFTFLGIAGVSQIYNSNTYFSDAQLTDLSNGGWFVFAQQNPQSLPYSIHQLTTDPQTLESGEYSVVKNFDFVSMFFVDILTAFLGVYNVTPEAMSFIRTALYTGGELLRQRVYAKIGAPLTSFSISDLYVSPLSADRVVTHLAIGLPKPLNVIELHLVA